MGYIVVFATLPAALETLGAFNDDVGHDRPLLQHVQRPENHCLKDPKHPGNLDLVAEYYIATLLSVEAMAMAYLVRSAFPASELQDQALVHHMDVVEMSL